MKCGVCEKQITIFTKCHDCGQGIILEQMTNKPVQNFHCNNKGRHFSDPGFKPVCSNQCADCAEEYPPLSTDGKMEAVQQHEWVKVKARYSNTWRQCIHCKNCHEAEQGSYVSPNGEYLKEEPKCITRPATECEHVNSSWSSEFMTRVCDDCGHKLPEDPGGQYAMGPGH